MSIRASYSGSFLALVVCASGCAGVNASAAHATRVNLSDLQGEQRGAALARLTQLPTVIALKRGERVPLSLGIDSELFALEGSGLVLLAKRDFFVLLRQDGPPLFSLDGVDFEQRHRNSFLVGFHVDKTQPTELQLRLGVWANGSGSK
ncbi:MAG: hypothetical protein ABIQ16_23475 [Polyangiaceae bacterium]